MCHPVHSFDFRREFESPQGWDIWDSQTTYTSLHMWTLSVTWLVALGLGIAAALMMEHDPNRRPGCSIPVNPFVNPHSQTVTDPGFNFVLSFVILGSVQQSCLSAQFAFQCSNLLQLLNAKKNVQFHLNLHFNLQL